MAEHDTIEPGAPRAAPTRTKRLSLAAAAVTGLLVGGLATAAVSQGPGFGYGHWHGGGPGFGFGPMDPAAVDQRIERAIKHAAIEIDASKEQQDKIIAIAKTAAADLRPLRERAMAARTRGRELFAQPTIDRTAVEKLRAEQMATADEASRRFVKALTDAAEVLSPEQRKQMAERWPPFGGWHRGWHRG